MYQKDHIRVYLSLAAILFFAPFVVNLLKTTSMEIDKEDRDFIGGYVYFGYATISILLVLIGSYILSFFYKIQIFGLVYEYGIFPLLALLVVGTCMIFSHKKIFSGHTSTQREQTQGNKTSILVSFIPFYNIYLRYEQQDFTKGFWRLKESLLWWFSLVALILLVKNDIINSLFLIILIVRVSSLLANVDILPQHSKQKINTLFKKHLESIIAYPLGYLSFIFAKTHSTIQKKPLSEEQNTIQHHIQKYKILFETEIDFAHLTMIHYLQYTLLIVIIAWGLQQTFLQNMYGGIYNLYAYIGRGLVIMRYITILRHKYIIHIPFLYHIALYTTHAYHQVQKLFRKQHSENN